VISTIRRARTGLLVAGLLGLAACAEPREGPAAAPPQEGTAGVAGLRESDGSTRPRVVVLGDSLTAGLGLAAEEAYPALLQQRIDERGWPYEVVNHGESGGTTAGGLSRLDWALRGDVRILVVALGGNDGLRGLPPGEMKRNLSAIVGEAQRRGISVLIAGMEAPPNLGEDYTSEFRQVFRDVAGETHAAFVPFLLEGVAGIPELNQTDEIHPTAEGAHIIAGTIWSALEPLLEAVSAS